MPVPTPIAGDSTVAGTVVIQGCGNPCDPCGSGSAPGSGPGSVINLPCDPGCDAPTTIHATPLSGGCCWEIGTSVALTYGPDPASAYTSATDAYSGVGPVSPGCTTFDGQPITSLGYSWDPCSGSGLLFVFRNADWTGASGVVTLGGAFVADLCPGPLDKTVSTGLGLVGWCLLSGTPGLIHMTV